MEPPQIGRAKSWRTIAVMQLLWTLLRALFPTDPVQQCIGAARHRIALMASEVFRPQTLFLLARDTQARLYIEALIIDYEAALHMAIGARACQIARMRFRFHPKNFYRPTRALNTAALLKRIRALVTMCNNIERLAQIRAERLRRERDADPLAFGAYGSTDAWLRHAAHHEAVSVASISTSASLGLMVSSTRSVRPSNHEAVLAARATSARAPPVFHVQHHPQLASQSHLRERGPVRIDNFPPFHHIPAILGGHADEAREARLIPRVVSTPASVHPCFPQ